MAKRAQELLGSQNYFLAAEDSQARPNQTCGRRVVGRQTGITKSSTARIIF
jgi:hypothetical protein